MSDSVWPHRRQPARLPHPWDSPGKDTGVGCHFLLQCMKMKSESEVAQSCPNPSDPMDCSLPGSSIHGIFQARVLEWGAIAFFSFSLLVYNLWFLWWLSEMASYSWSRQLILDKSLWWLNSWEKKQDWVTQFDYNHRITIIGLLHSLQAEKKFIRSGKSICFPKKCHPWSLK